MPEGSSTYPGAVDDLPIDVGSATGSRTGKPEPNASPGHHAENHNNANAAIVALQQTLGTNPQGASGDVSTRLGTEETRAKAAEAVAKAVADAALPKAGGTMAGKIVLDGDPTLNLHPATKQYVLAQIAALVAGAPGALDTLKEIADALEGEDDAVAALVTSVAAEQEARETLQGALAAAPDVLIVGEIERDENGAALSASVLWPDGTAGKYEALTISEAFLGAVDSYSVTYGEPATRTYTQPAVTRDAFSGAVVDRPEIEVS